MTFGVTVSGTTLADVQAAINSLGANGGLVEVPAGNYAGNSPLTLTKSNITILGEGGDYDETSTLHAPTLFDVSSASCDGIQIGAQDRVICGVKIKDIGIKGNSAADASGIHGIYNAAANVFPARCLFDGVSAKGFANGHGIIFDFAVSTTCRRTNTSQNLYGIRVIGGTDYDFDGIISRSNGAYGLELEGFNGVSIRGGSVLESNQSSAILALLYANAYNLFVENSWFENNNLVVTGTPYQIHVIARGGFLLQNGVIDKCNFADGHGSGDIYLDASRYIDIEHIRSTFSDPNILVKGPSSSQIRYNYSPF